MARLHETAKQQGAVLPRDHTVTTARHCGPRLEGSLSLITASMAAIGRLRRALDDPQLGRGSLKRCRERRRAGRGDLK